MTQDWIKKPKYLSHYLVILNVIIFAIIFAVDQETSTLTLIDFGAKINYRILDGEYWRLLSAMFLHADLMHLMFNCVALLSIGPEIEMIFGKKKFLTIYFLSGLIASVGSFLFSNNISVGASGAIFGLIGANIFLFTYDREKYKAIYGNQILVLLVINIIYGIMNEKIDDVAHLAGFVGGFVVAWATGFNYMSKYNWKNKLAAVCVPILLIGGFYVGTIRYANDPDYYYMKGAFLLNDGNVLGAQQVFSNGLKHFPDHEEFKSMLDQIKQMQDILNKK